MDYAAQFQARKDATQDLTSPEQLDRLLVLFKKGRNMFASLFSEVDVIRRQINNEALFSDWCVYQLRISVGSLSSLSAVFKEDDAARIRNEFAEARRAEREKHELELHARRMAALDRKNALSAKKLENAEHQAAEEARVIAQKAAERRERRRQIAAVEGDGIQRARRWWEKNPYATHRECEKATGVGHGHSVSARRALVDQCVIPKQREAALAAYDSLTDEAKFERCVKEGIQAVNHQWVLGDLAIKVSALKSYGANVLERFATRIDVEYQTLKRYRSVAQLWPEKGIRIPFSVAMILSTHPDRFTIASKDPGMSCENARRIMRAYKGPTNVIPIRAAR